MRFLRRAAPSWFWDFFSGVWTQPISEKENSLIRSVTLESTYFPLIDREGKPFRGSYYLTVNPGGLSSVPIPNDK